MLITFENSRVKDRYDHQEASLYYLGIIKFAQLLLLDN